MNACTSPLESQATLTSWVAGRSLSRWDQTASRSASMQPPRNSGARMWAYASRQLAAWIAAMSAASSSVAGRIMTSAKHALLLAFPMRIVFREHILEIIPAFPFRWRRLVAGSGNELVRRHGSGIPHQVRNVARAVREDLAFDAHDDLRAMMHGERFRVVVDRCLAAD